MLGEKQIVYEERLIGYNRKGGNDINIYTYIQYKISFPNRLRITELLYWGCINNQIGPHLLTGVYSVSGLIRVAVALPDSRKSHSAHSILNTPTTYGYNNALIFHVLWEMFN